MYYRGNRVYVATSGDVSNLSNDTYKQTIAVVVVSPLEYAESERAWFRVNPGKEDTDTEHGLYKESGPGEGVDRAEGKGGEAGDGASRKFRGGERSVQGCARSR